MFFLFNEILIFKVTCHSSLRHISSCWATWTRLSRNQCIKYLEGSRGLYWQYKIEHSAEMQEPAEPWTAELCCSLTRVGTDASKPHFLGAVPETDKPQVLFFTGLGCWHSSAAELHLGLNLSLSGFFNLARHRQQLYFIFILAASMHPITVHRYHWMQGHKLLLNRCQLK